MTEDGPRQPPSKPQPILSRKFNRPLTPREPTAASLSTLPLSLLHAELSRRQQTDDASSLSSSNETRPACGSSSNLSSYNTALHVFALFLILTLSTLACSFPLVVRRFPKLPVPNYALFLSRHFGTGVLIATAFVHLLPTAYVNLTDPCLPRFWNEVYPAFAGFVAMVSVMMVVGIEMFFASKGAGHSHGGGLDLDVLLRQGAGGDDVGGGGGVGGGAGSGSTAGILRPRRPSGTFRPLRMTPIGFDPDAAPNAPLGNSPYSDEPGSRDKPLPPPPGVGRIEEDDQETAGGNREEDEDEDLDLDELEAEQGEEENAGDTTGLLNGKAVDSPEQQHNRSKSRGAAAGRGSRTVSFAEPLHSPGHDSAGLHAAKTDSNEQRLVLQCLLLEAGILFHSVFIGMALSVSTGPAFVVLLIAISFHQTFEGLALGSRIAGIPSFSTESMKPWFMSVMYGVTTPIGQAIGLAVHTLYDPASQFGLLTVGIVNAISSGLLIYAGLVQLLAEDFLSDQSYHDLRGRRRLEACGAVVLGSMLMAFVGAFA